MKEIHENHADVLILGGGASGLCAAADLAEQGLHVLLLERQDRVGRKLLATGNGRSNLSNTQMTPEAYGSAAPFVRSVFEEASPQVVLHFWETHGLMLCQEEGRVYPRTRMASTVLDVLRQACTRSNVRIVTEAEVTKLAHHGEWQAATRDGRTFTAPRVLLAMGGCAAPQFGTDGAGLRLCQMLGMHTVDPFPALVQLRCARPYAALKGLRVHATPVLYIDGQEMAREEGELLFTDYGLSGVCILQLSGLAAQALQQKSAVEIRIDLLPEMTDKVSWLSARYQSSPGLDALSLLTGVFPRMLAQTLLKACGLPLSTPFKSSDISRLAEQIAAFPMAVNGTQGFANAQVSGGGVSLDEIDPHTLEARRYPGLYLAGELLDVTGPCGGYHLHFAFASALAASKAILRGAL